MQVLEEVGLLHSCTRCGAVAHVLAALGGDWAGTGPSGIMCSTQLLAALEPRKLVNLLQVGSCSLPCAV